MTITIDGPAIRLTDEDFTELVIGSTLLPETEQPLLPDALASVREPAALFQVSMASVDHGWNHQFWLGAAGLVCVLDLDGTERQLLTAPIDALPGLVAKLTGLGPRHSEGVRKPIPATVKGLQRLLEAGPAERAKRLGPFGADRLWVLEGTGFHPDGSVAAQESLLVLDGPGGVWVPEDGRIVPSTPTAIWTFLTAILVNLSTAGLSVDDQRGGSTDS